MKKTWMIGLIFVALAALSIGIVAPALAHNTTGQNTTAGPTVDHMGEFGGPTMTRVAEALGMTTDELTTRLKTGETLAQIAQSLNVAEEILIDSLVAPYADQLELRVRYEYLTREQADSLLQEVREWAVTYINEDLSGTTGNTGWWEEMEEYCDDRMGDFGGMMGSGFGGMMGDGMHGWSGQDGFGGMMGPGYGFGSIPESGITPRTGSGFGGMMGGGFSGGMMGGW